MSKERTMTEDERRFRIQGMINKKQLKVKYGWTDRMIEKYLIVAEERDNYRRMGSIVKFYREEDVKAAMETEEFKEDFERLMNRRNGIKNEPKLKAPPKTPEEIKADYMKKLTGCDVEADLPKDKEAEFEAVYEALSEKEKSLVNLRLEGKNLRECGEVLGKSHETMRRLEKKIKEKFL